METIEYSVAWADEDWGSVLNGKYTTGIDNKFLVSQKVARKINTQRVGSHLTFLAYDLRNQQEIKINSVIRSRWQ